MTDRGDVDRVRAATDIVDLMTEVTQVKQSGRLHMAICPFHEEKTPSMSVDRAKGLYHCFGCGKGGDVFSFVQESQGADFPETLEILARRAGITLAFDPDAAERRGRRAAAVEAIRRAIDIYHRHLKEAPEAGSARAYLRGRGYDTDIIDEWRIGFSGANWDTLARALKTGGVDDEAVIDAGLAKRGRRGLYDFFRGRLMFPIHDLRGDPVGFGGRRVEEVDPESTNNPDAKYVNSPVSVVYQKAQVLFGLDRARRAMRADGEAVIVEGYTDVIAMHQAGVNTAVATCGTALGDGHFDLLRRFTEKVVLAFDSDEAGSEAASRSDQLESPFRLDLEMRVAVMPEGLDPADLVREGRGDELAKAVADARPLLEHRIEREISRFDLSGPEGRARAVHAAAAQAKRVSDPIARGEYARFIARLTGVDLSTVEPAVGGRTRTRSEAETQPDRPIGRADLDLLRVVLSNPARVEDIETSDFSDRRSASAFADLSEAIGSTEPGGELDIGAVSDEGSQALLRSVSLDRSPMPDEDFVFRRVKVRRIERRIDSLEQDLAKLPPDTEEYSEAWRALLALQKERRALGEHE